MKILILSLLRLGDIYMHLHLIQDIKKKWPLAKIEVLINSQFAHISDTSLLVDNYHLFPRLELQNELVSEDGNVFKAYGNLKHLINSLNDQSFDIVFDFTHTFLSNKLMDSLQIKKKVGSELGYFNDVFSISSHTSFHYVDSLRHALGIDHLSEVPIIEKRTNKHITIQPLTSDKKKNWNISGFQYLVQKIQIELPEYMISIVGSPSEENEIRQKFNETENLKIEILSLTQIQFLLWETSLLISGDTAIIHLASHCKTPCLNIFVGSADPFKTSAYLQGAISIHAEEACAPCSHSEKCRYETFKCHDSIDKEHFAEIAIAKLKGQNINFSKYHFHSYENAIFYNKKIILKDLSSDFNYLFQSIRQLARSLMGNLPAYDNSKYLLTDLIDLKTALNLNLQVLTEIEENIRDISKELVNIDFSEISWDQTLQRLTELIKEFSFLNSDEEQISQLRLLIEKSNYENPYMFFKNAKWILSSIAEVLSNQQIIVSTIIKNTNEKGLNYVTGPRKLS